ncbi:hypothetical protein H0O00_03100 [Candidatus Micrarchaeota archaeon]|nr:hypothetical protein [Candidatus Micrarchaeota archaeon]
MLLIDYLEKAAAYIHERKAAMMRLEAQYRRIYDPDIKKEIATLKQEIRRKHGEINMEILLNLEEFRALKKYFPDLLKVLEEDDCIGKAVSRKLWLLDFKSMPPKEASERFGKVQHDRAQLKDARTFLKKWVGRVASRSITATYPVLKPLITSDMDKDDALEAIDKADKELRRQGWLVLLSDSLIEMPLNRFMVLIGGLSYQEDKANAEVKRASAQGTVAEAKALSNLKGIAGRKGHYERMVTQILLANPSYLKDLKKRKSWLSREKASSLERFARDVTPHSLKERAWLNDMKKKIAG